MVWFQRELADAVMCCTQPKRVSQFGTKVLYTCVWYKWHLTRIACAITGRCSIWENVGSHWRKPSYRQIRSRNLKSFCRWSLRNRWNRNWTTCSSWTQKKKKDVQVGSEYWNDVLFTGQRNRWMKDPQLGPSVEVSQERAIEELGEIPV